MYSKKEVKKAVYEGLREITKKEVITIKDDEKFSDYGIDSLDRMSLLLEVEKRLNVELGDIDLDEANTIDSLYKLICDKYK